MQRDLGVVLIAGLNRLDDGKKAFAEALEADPDIGLEKALTTPEIEQIFRAAKMRRRPVGVAATAVARSHPGRGAIRRVGDMIHTPPAEQKALTAVPIYVELPAGIVAVKVVARYKPYGTSEWKTLELRRLGPGYGAEVPCRDVGSTTGDFVYFVQATDAAGDVVSMSGSRAAPNKVPIKNALTGEPPHLPGVIRRPSAPTAPIVHPVCPAARGQSRRRPEGGARAASRTVNATKGSRAKTACATTARRRVGGADVFGQTVRQLRWV